VSDPTSEIPPEDRTRGPQPTPAEETRGEERPGPVGHVLRRSTDDRIIAGVCGGLARYFGVDSTLVRLAFVLLTVAGGGGVLVYLVALILMPEERPGEAVSGPPASSQRREGLWFFAGVGLVALGLILLIGELVPWFDRFFGPLVLIALGVVILVHVTRR
jgi:phage shock protein PspC (stress-responsive transcriptional regulator)